MYKPQRRELIQRMLREALEAQERYFREHPKARYVSDGVEGFANGLNFAAALVCAALVGHDYREAHDHTYCAVCGDRRYPEIKQEGLKNANAVS